MIRRKHIAVIGAGPGGLMAAEILATACMEVTVYDRMKSPGRKLLMAGRGGLNLTHNEPLDRFMERYGTAASWLSPCIRAFPPQALRAWCEELGEETFVGSSGRVFPRSMKAAPLLRAWLRRLDKLGVQFRMSHHWQGWEKDALRFTDKNQTEVRVTPDATLLALGGATWPRLGSDGGWVGMLSAGGVAVTPLRAANCGFTANWSDHFSARFAGAPLKPVSLTHKQHTQQGEAVITSRGMEGGVVYALSASLRDSIETCGAAHVQLDLRPGITTQALAGKLQSTRANKSMSTYLRKAGFSPLAVGLLRETTEAKDVAQMTPEALAARLKALPVTFTATAGMQRAISTAGGIAREAVNEDFMLLAKPGVFVAGEMLDWEAPTGGYLLQACFSTAVAAAQGILDKVKSR